MTAAAYFEHRRESNIIEAEGEMGFVQRVLSDKIILPSGPLRDSLLEELEKVISLAEAGNALSFLDHRIVELQAKLSEQMELDK